MQYDYDQEYCFFFGTFNPVHYGHLIMAEMAMERLKIKKVLFVPAYLPPHRQNENDIAPFSNRLKMVQLACRENKAFEVSSIESQRKELSYTVETLKVLIPGFDRSEKKFPFIIGADALKQLGSWYQAEILADRMYFIQAPRLGYSKINKIQIGEKTVSINTYLLEMPSVEISSTLIRQCIAEGISFRFFTPKSVVDYIKWNRLYL